MSKVPKAVSQEISTYEDAPVATPYVPPTRTSSPTWREIDVITKAAEDMGFKPGAIVARFTEATHFHASDPKNWGVVTHLNKSHLTLNTIYRPIRVSFFGSAVSVDCDAQDLIVVIPVQWIDIMNRIEAEKKRRNEIEAAKLAENTQKAIEEAYDDAAFMGF